MDRIAAVLAPRLRAEGDLSRTRDLAAALLDASPRVAAAGPGLCRADAGGWRRRGGEGALARALREAARREGIGEVGVGIADVPAVADAAALVAARAGEGTAEDVTGGGPEGTRVVPSGREREFLAPLPLEVLPLPAEMRETLRALGLRRVGELAARDRGEVEARFGPDGIRAHRWARGEDDRVPWLPFPEEEPGASLELDGPVRTTEPLLFVLRRLLGRACADLEEGGWCAERVLLRLELEGGEAREVSVAPARPTRREGLLLDLCRAALERAAGGGEPAAGAEGGERLPAAVVAVAVRVPARAPAEARQGDLFAAEPRDPAAAAATLSRIRARLGEDAAVRPAPREEHRPELRSGWEAVRPAEAAPGGGKAPPPGEEAVSRAGRGGPPAAASSDAVPGVLRLLSEPRRVGVRTEEGRPAELRDRGLSHGVAAAEGPERLSGHWWREPFRREYWRVCTERGELLWIFRDFAGGGEGGARGGEEPEWRLHGWWD